MVQLRKALAMTVPVGASTTITVLVGALLPGPVGFTLFVGGLAVAAVLALGIREDLAAAVLLRARPLTPGVWERASAQSRRDTPRFQHAAMAPNVL